MNELKRTFENLLKTAEVLKKNQIPKPSFKIKNENLKKLINDVATNKLYNDAKVGSQFTAPLEMRGIKYTLIIEKGDGEILINILNKKGEVLI
jgi:hypothetical protein